MENQTSSNSNGCMENSMMTLLPVPQLPNVEGWTKKLNNLLSERKDNVREIYIIVIARKMARLFEYFKKLGYLDFLDDYNYKVITEHAVPLCLDRINDEDLIIIIDDLIIYGETVETVSDQIYYLTSQKSKVFALAATKWSEKLNLRNADLIFPNPNENKDKCYFLDEELIPAFTARNSKFILSMKGSIDIEHTILKISNLKKNTIENLNNQLEGSLKKIFFQDIVYEVVHSLNGEIVKSITVVLNKNKNNLINNDFNKLRFFIGDDFLKIVSYAPNIWKQNDLDINIGKIYGIQELDFCLKLIVDKLNQLSTNQERKVTDIDSLFYKLSFDRRVDLTKIVWSNYLLSFLNVLFFKSKINESLTPILGNDFILEIDSNDINLLIGKELSNIVLPQLNNVINKNDGFIKISYKNNIEENLLKEPLIPAEGRDNYEYLKLLNIHQSIDPEMALSLIFYRLRNEFGLINNRLRREDKIRVGESFESLYESLNTFFDHDNLMMRIHKWIDERIDLGVVVPKYDFFYDRFGERNWRRFFRSGEREDVLEDLSRISIDLIKNYFKTEPTKVITLQNFIKIINNSYESFIKVFYKNQFDLIFNLYLNDVHKDKMIENVGIYLWNYLIASNIIKPDITNNWKSAEINYDSKKGNYV